MMKRAGMRRLPILAKADMRLLAGSFRIFIYLMMKMSRRVLIALKYRAISWPSSP